MFCNKCGTQLPDGASICSGCGAATSAPNVVPPKSGNTIDFKNPKILAIGAAVLAVVVLISVFTLFFGGQSYKTAVNSFMDGIFEGNGSKILKALPDDVVDMMCEEEDMTEREMARELSETMEEFTESFDYLVGEDWTVDYEIVDTDDYSRSDLRDLQEIYEEIDIDVKDAMTVIVELTVEADGESETLDMEIGVVKIGGSWYVDVQNVDMPF